MTDMGGSLLGVLFYPATRVDKGVKPGREVVIASFARVETALPREDGAFEVRHHCKVTAVV